MAEFNTEITVKGSREEYLNVLKVLRYYSEDRYEQYSSHKDCWYLSGVSLQDEDIDNYIKDGSMIVAVSGPYGVWTDPFDNCIDLFEKIADAVPDCWFCGSVSGWDAGGEFELSAELKDSILYLKQVYHPHDAQQEQSDYTFDRQYDPVKHIYFNSSSDNSEVTITITIYDSNGKKREMVLSDADVSGDLVIYCYPQELLSADSVTSLFELLASSVWTAYDDVETDSFRKQIMEFGNQILSEEPEFKLSKLCIQRIINSETSFLFDWLRSDEYEQFADAANAISKCTEDTRQEILDEFSSIIDSTEYYFPAFDEWPEWPELCLYHCDILDNGCSLSPNTDNKLKPKLNWRGVAGSLDAFANYILSDNEPIEFALETVVIDYINGTTEHTAEYIPNDSEYKTSHK